jgi:hypothetical protein
MSTVDPVGAEILIVCELDKVEPLTVKTLRPDEVPVKSRVFPASKPLVVPFAVSEARLDDRFEYVV